MTNKPRVLLVEDDSSVADAVDLVLCDNGYEVTVAMTGTEGIDLAARQTFDVTITDLRLPDMSGFEVITSIRDKHPHSLIILITAHFTPEVAAESKRRGAAEALAKPFVPSDILGVLCKALRARQSISR